MMCIGAPGSPDWPSDYCLSQLSFKRLVSEMSRYLGCNNEPESVVIARNAMAGASYAKYVNRLLKDVGIEHLLLDLGFPGPQTYPEFELPRNAVKPRDSSLGI